MAAAQAPAFTEALIFLGAAVVAVPLFRWLRLGSALGYLAAGLAIGPFGLDLFQDTAMVRRLAELGVVLFLFIIGLELNLSRLWAMRHDILVLGTSQLVVCGLLGMLYPLLVVGRSWQAALVAGLGLALSSTALVMQLLEERGEVQTPHGRKVFAILLLQDLAIVPLLALVALLAPGGGEGREPAWFAALKIACALGVVIVAGRFLLSPLFRILASSRAREVMTAAALLVVLAAASAMTFAGLSPALGALLAGLLLAESTYRHELKADIEPFRGLFLGLFFMSVGMTVDPGVVARAWLVLLGAVASLFVIKIVSIYGLMRAMRNSHETSVRTALLLPQAGEFGFVLYSAALAAGVIPQEMATRLVALVILTMALTPPLLALAPRLLRRRPGREREETFEGARGGVLLIGFGRFGQIVSQLLVLEGIDVTAIDIDVEMIEAAERFGFKVYYSDGTRLEVLRAAGAERAYIICVCVEKKETASHIVDAVRATFPLARLYVRSYDRIHTLELLERGVDFEVRETYESAISFGRAALEGLELPPEHVTELEVEMRRRDRERLALQQQGTLESGREGVYTRLVPRPEPLTSPRRKGVVLHRPDASGTEAGPTPPSPRDGEHEP